MPEISPAADKDAIRKHLSHLTRRWGELDEPCLLEIVHLSAEDAAQVKQVSHYAPDEMGIDIAVDDICAFNALKINCYATVNPVSATNRPKAGRRAAAEHIVASFFHFADADSAESADNIRNFVGPRSTFQVITGTQPCVRPHVYWELEDPARNLRAWSETQAAIAATLNTDKVIDPPRIMRIGGTVNWPKPKKIAKGYRPEVTILKIHDDRAPVSSETMARAFGRTAKPAETLSIDTGPAPLDRERTRIQALSGEEWHNAVVRLVASYVAKGLSDEEIHGLAAPLTLSGYTTDQTRAEVQTAIDGARRKGWTPKEYATPENIQTEPAPSQEPAQSGPSGKLEWFDDVEPVLSDSYIIKGVIGQEAMSVVYGPSNSGKTFFALDMACNVAAGTQHWRGHRVRQAAVLYLAAEGGRGIANRIAALKNLHGLCDVPFALRRAGLDLLRGQADLQHVYDLAQEIRGKYPDFPLMIVIDTLSRVIAGGDENSAQDMTAFIRNIDAIRAATNAHIMIVHHTGKDTARGARGHSSLRAATDTEIEVQNEDGARAAMITKQRDYEGGQVFAFELKTVILGIDQDGDEVSTCVLEEADSEEFKAAKTARKGRGKNQQIIMETFDQMVAEGLATGNPGGVGMPEPGQFWAVETARLREIAQGKMVGERASALFRQAWEALTGQNGLFVTGHNLCWRIDRRKS